MMVVRPLVLRPNGTVSPPRLLGGDETGVRNGQRTIPDLWLPTLSAQKLLVEMNRSSHGSDTFQRLPEPSDTPTLPLPASGPSMTWWKSRRPLLV